MYAPSVANASSLTGRIEILIRPSSRLKVIRPSIISPTFKLLVISLRCIKAIQRSGVIKNAPSDVIL